MRRRPRLTLAPHELDQPVRRYVPELRLQDDSTAETVTVGQLLNHTAGWDGGDAWTDTGDGDDAVGRAVELLAALPQLTARHHVVVASVADPAFAAAIGRRGALADVYAAAAAERARLDADRVAAAIERLGGSTVTASPHELPPALADHYLALKAAGRL
jgi:CubicO group peptidase (beta-lactamase class C family)